MGRRNILPDEPELPIKLRLQAVPLVDGCYDQGGAYWGAPANLWCAWAEDFQFFLRASTRELAKQRVLQAVPRATFYR